MMATSGDWPPGQLAGVVVHDTPLGGGAGVYVSLHTSNPDAELQQLIADADPPRCTVVFECDEHGEEECGIRARWRGEVYCHKDRDRVSDTFLACDGCRDSISGNHGDDHEVVWTEL